MATTGQYKVRHDDENIEMGVADTTTKDPDHNDVNDAAFDNPAYVGSSHNDIAKTEDIGLKDVNHDPDPDKQISQTPKDSSPKPEGIFSRTVFKIQNGVSNAYAKHGRVIGFVVGIILLLAYFAYFGYSLYCCYGDEGSIRLLTVTVIVVVSIIVSRTNIFHQISSRVEKWYEGQSEAKQKKVIKAIKICVLLLIAAFWVYVAYVIIDLGIKSPKNMMSLLGIFSFIFLFFIFSVNPARVKWRPVLLGLTIQFAFALIILQSQWGFDAFQWLGERVQEFLTYADAGGDFVFGPGVNQHFFAFKVLPVIIFFSTIVSMLYFAGVMQFIIRHLGRGLAFAMGTSPAESLNAAGNIFIGQTEAPLMIRPFIAKLTKSELHAVLTGGFATIAGSVMAAYILYGVPANHLLAASVMSAPAALAMSKLIYPETEETQFKGDDVYNMKAGDERNIIEAASNGASASIKLVANIAVNLIAFMSLLAFVNATLVWFGHRAGVSDPELTFELICSYIFWPIPFVMGVDIIDCRRVASLIGLKTFLNEFVAYTQLGIYIENAAVLKDLPINATLQYFPNNDDIFVESLNKTLLGGALTIRSEVIATYALCGFSNFGSIGIMLGGLSAMAPSRKGDISEIVLRAMIAGNVACFMTACIAGLLLNPDIL